MNPKQNNDYDFDNCLRHEWLEMLEEQRQQASAKAKLEEQRQQASAKAKPLTPAQYEAQRQEMQKRYLADLYEQSKSWVRPSFFISLFWFHFVMSLLILIL